MRAWVGGLLFSGLALAQGFGNLFDKAPPHIEEALRARVNHFYQAHVEGKFRLADQVVHEDSKDTFFAAEKPRYEGFKIISITYEENFTKAKVVVDVDDYFVFLGIGRMKINRAVPSLWKFDGGQWWWYVNPYDPAKGKDSPFGTLRDTPGAEAPRVDVAAEMANAGKLVERLQNAVKASTTEIELQSVVPSSDEVVFTNNFDGRVTLQLDAPETLGLELKFDKTVLDANESAKLTVSYTPHNKAWKPEVAARVRVDPTSQVIALRIAFALPPKDAAAAVAPPVPPSKQ